MHSFPFRLVCLQLLVAAQPIVFGADRYVPVFVTGSAGDDLVYVSRLNVINMSNEATPVEVEAYDDLGDDVTDAMLIGETAVNILPGGSREFLSSLPLPPIETTQGWLRVVFPDGANLLLSYEVTTVGTNHQEETPFRQYATPISQVRGIPLEEKSSWTALYRIFNWTRDTAFAIVNPSDLTASVEVTWTDHQNKRGQTGTATLEIPPNNRQTRLLLDMFPAARPMEHNICCLPVQTVGTLEFESDQAIVVGIADYMSFSGRFLNGLYLNHLE